MSLSSEFLQMEQLEETVLATLHTVVDGESGSDVVDSGQVYAVVATGTAVRVLLDPDRFPNQISQDSLAETLMPLVEAIPGVARAVVKPRPQPVALAKALPGVRHIIGVHSGKGGVGKSTISVNLALALAKRGLKVGLMDADVYGPSAPTLLGLSGRLQTTADGRKVLPKEKYGLKVASLGFLLPEGQALIWRGSLVDEGLAQLFSDVQWGELDVLLVDLPPGTSDVHLAVARQAPMSGVVVVTAPGQVSVDDVRRGMEMFADLAVPCLGLVENMTGVVCRRCGEETPVFGTGGAAELAAQTGLPIMAQLPFYPPLAEAADAGKPPVAEFPDSPIAAPFHALAAQLALSLKLDEEQAGAEHSESSYE